MKHLDEIKRSDIFEHLISLTYLPRWGVLLLDLVLTLIAYTLSYAIGTKLIGYIPSPDILPIWEQAAVVMTTQLVFFWIFHTYSGILRFSTFVDTIKVALSVFSAGAILLIGNAAAAFWARSILLNSVIIIYIFVGMVILFSWRVTIKTVFEYISHSNRNIRHVLIYGVQSAGLSIAKMLMSNMDSSYKPVGFISDDDAKHSHDLLGLKVYNKDEKLIEIMREKGIHDIIVSPLKLKQIDPLTGLNIFLDNGINVLRASYITDLKGKFEPEATQNYTMPNIRSIESIRVEDLLERPSIQIDTDNVSMILKDRVVMITGAAGSIGSEIVRQVCTYQPRVIVLFEMAESPLHDLSMDLKTEFPSQQIIRVIGDVRNLRMVENVFQEYKPHIVFHAAAYKHVPLMEEYPQQAVLANVLGTKNVADMAVKYAVERFVMISTDKAVNPTNVMGATKRVAEMYVQSLGQKVQTTKFITTRFGNVLGSNGSVVPYFKKQIAAGGPVTVTHPDIIRYFMTIPEAACLVLEAATLGNGGEIFVFDMGRPVKIADLARNMIRLAGFVPGQDIRIEYTGLRPGEKLYEELLNQKETTLPTPNGKIRIAKVRSNEYEQVAPLVEQLIHEAKDGKEFPTVSLIKQIVPEYKSRNSIYEQLDK